MVLASLILPLTQMRPAVAGSIIAGLAAVGGAAATIAAIDFYKAVDGGGIVYQGPVVAGVGVLVVLVGGIAYGLSGRRALR